MINTNIVFVIFAKQKSAGGNLSPTTPRRFIGNSCVRTAPGPDPRAVTNEPRSEVITGGGISGHFCTFFFIFSFFFFLRFLGH